VVKSYCTSILILFATVIGTVAIAHSAMAAESNEPCKTAACWAERNTPNHSVKPMPMKTKPTATTRDASLDNVTASATKECNSVACWSEKHTPNHNVRPMPTKNKKPADAKAESKTTGSKETNQQSGDDKRLSDSKKTAPLATRQETNPATPPETKPEPLTESRPAANEKTETRPARKKERARVSSADLSLQGGPKDDDDDEQDASDEPKYSSKTEADFACPTGKCRTNTVQNPIETLRLASDVIKTVSQKRGELADPKYKPGQAPACNQFTEDNKLKEYGEMTVEIMSRPYMKPLLDGTPDIHRLCPNYSIAENEGGMTMAQKHGFFILLVSGVVHKEASCDEDAMLPKKTKAFPKGAPYGVAYGLFQLNRGNEAQYSPRSHICKDGDAEEAKTSIQCGLGMWNERAQQGLPIFASHHWDVLNPSKRKAQDIQANLRSYPYCKRKFNASTKLANR
jgi:hypothetical protein